MRLFVSTLLMLLALVSCEKQNSESDPLLWLHYLAIVDENGTDFFQVNPDYSFPSIVLPQSDLTEPLEDTLLADNLNLLGLHPFVWGRGEMILLDYGNGDTDTLEVIITPSDLSNPSINDGLLTISTYFNDELIATWDFTNNDELRFQMQSTNDPAARNDGDTPFYLTLTKVR